MQEHWQDPLEQGPLSVELPRQQYIRLEVLGRKRRMSVEEQILDAIARYIASRTDDGDSDDLDWWKKDSQ